VAKTSGRVKLAAATIGGGALVTMGALTFAAGGQPAVSPSFVSNGMQTGVTITETTPGTVLATSLAVPPVKAPPFGKS
jgi:hypothetical protein